MIPFSFSPRRCIYCAFRAHRVALQSLRLRSNAASTRKGSGLRIRYTGDQQYGSRFSPLGRFVGDEKFQRTRFIKEVESSLAKLKDELREIPLMEEVRREQEAEIENGTNIAFGRIWKPFSEQLLQVVKAGEPLPEQFGVPNAPDVVDFLSKGMGNKGTDGLDQSIKHLFYGYVTGQRFSKSDIKNQRTLADLRYPSEWYPATRALQRTVHVHVGPTNSGKTYQALQRLEQAKSGVYAGPLRLLAHEVYSRMNAKGINCSLVTGEERRRSNEQNPESEAELVACTVEMLPMNITLDVAVIDEIQMLGNKERGWAWTAGVLGVKAKELHLCGEERAVPIIKELCASVGDKVVVHRYNRLSPLRMADESLNGSLKQLRKGDCIVSFSVMGIHAMRRQVEKATGRKVAIVYGGLPPETRAAQARLFNDPDNDYDFLVASDAVGMGLNLAIKRIIFESASKFDGKQHRTLPIADIKQIGGRAGRYRTAAQASKTSMSEQSLAAAKGEEPLPAPQGVAEEEESVGLVTTLEKHDFPIVQQAMNSEPEPIRSAGLFPPAPVVERFASYFPPGTPFSYILTRLHELSQMHPRFYLCGLRDQLYIADMIEPVRNLTVTDRSTFCAAPASKSEKELWSKLMPAYARCVANQTGGHIADIKELPLETLELEVSASRDYLRALERLHKGVVTYLWLSYRFAGVFSTRPLAFHIKSLVEEKIEHVLSQFSFSAGQRKKIAAKRGILLQNERDDGDVLEDLEPTPAATTTTETPSDPAELSTYFTSPLDDQTSLSLGGDRFSGEVADDVGLDDPLAAGTVDSTSDAPAPSSGLKSNFAEWRSKQTAGESQGSHEPDDPNYGLRGRERKEKVVRED